MDRLIRQVHSQIYVITLRTVHHSCKFHSLHRRAEQEDPIRQVHTIIHFRVSHLLHILTNDCLLLSYKRSLGSCLIRYYVCRKARGSNKSACRSVMCAGCYDKMSFGGDEETGNRRSSSRSVKRKLSEKDDNIHATDANGCTHSNPDSFQAEYNGMYFDEVWRSKQDKANLLDETCLQCNGNV